MCDSIEATFKIHNNNKIGTKYIETFTSISFPSYFSHSHNSICSFISCSTVDYSLTLVSS